MSFLDSSDAPAVFETHLEYQLVLASPVNVLTQVHKSNKGWRRPACICDTDIFYDRQTSTFSALATLPVTLTMHRKFVRVMLKKKTDERLFPDVKAYFVCIKSRNNDPYKK